MKRFFQAYFQAVKRWKLFDWIVIILTWAEALYFCFFPPFRLAVPLLLIPPVLGIIWVLRSWWQMRKMKKEFEEAIKKFRDQN